MRKTTIVGAMALAAIMGLGTAACSPGVVGMNAADAAVSSGGRADSGTTGGTVDSGTTSVADSGPSEGGPDSGILASCKPNCTGETCGDDGCGGTCGGCPPSQLCGPAKTCVASPSTTSIVVDAKSQGTPISSGIYGVAFNSDDSMTIASLNRWGG